MLVTGARVRKLCLFFAVVFGCFGQGETEKWIRSDAAQVSPAAKRVFLEKICPGHANAQGCEVCPEGTGFAGNSKTSEASAILLGHFLSPSGEDALVSGFDCEDHADGFGGSFLLTKKELPGAESGTRRA